MCEDLILARRKLGTAELISVMILAPMIVIVKKISVLAVVRKLPETQGVGQ